MQDCFSRAVIERVLALKKVKQLILYLPESFEWLILKSDLLANSEVRAILDEPNEYIESQKYFSWERFFTALLSEKTQDTYMRYKKHELNPVFLNPHESKKILQQMPEMDFLG